MSSDLAFRCDKEKNSPALEHLATMWLPMTDLPYPKPRGRERNTPYMLVVKRLPCLGLTMFPGHQCHWFPYFRDAAHIGDRSQNRKADDDTTVPLCHTLHMQLHHLAGSWRGWTKADLEAWEPWAIMETRRQVWDYVAVHGMVKEER